MRAWDDAGIPPLRMAVNVSGRRLVTGDLAGAVADAAQSMGLDPRRLELEITETAAVEYEADAVQVITEVRALGVHVAIDDFGMGHSALSRLQSFPVDRLKIDRSFIAPLADGAEQGSIADAMIAMGGGLGLEVVAEGVETGEQLRALRRLGCACAQGYLFSKPVTAEEIQRLASADIVLAPIEDRGDAHGALDRDRSGPRRERLTRTLLAELQRLTGLESTYLTRIDSKRALQHITHARNTASTEIPEGLAVNWSDTVCRRALERGVAYTDDVPSTFPESRAAIELGLQTFASVPIVSSDGDIDGALCGASSRRVALGPDAVRVMEGFAGIIAEISAAERTSARASSSPAAPRACSRV